MWIDRGTKKVCVRIVVGALQRIKLHNEHIEPSHPGKIWQAPADYKNIVASCNNSETCGNKKGNNYDPQNFVSPLDEDCEDKFTYYPDGKIVEMNIQLIYWNLNAYEPKMREKL